MGIEVVSLVLALSIVFGMRYWTFRAETDRSAFVGLYLVFGFPGILLTVAGLALTTYGKEIGYVLLPLGVGLLLPLVPSFRRAVARWTPIDPTSPTDMVALSVVLGLVLAFFAEALLGPGPDSSNGSVNNTLLVVQVLAYVAFALAMVGFGITRDWRSSVDRLGVKRPTMRIVWIALAFLFACYVVSIIAGILTRAFQSGVSDEIDRSLRDMTSDVQNPLGAMVLALSAGIGEEIFFRGAIQPRVGIPLTAALFALLHVQYGLSFTLLGIFGLGIVLGYERQRYGTTPAMLTHAIFNFIAVLALTYS